VSFDACAGQITPARALHLALDAEKRAQAFFEHAARIATDPATRVLAREMASEEADHAAMIERALSRIGPATT
jgi:rubrerythrin